MLDFEYHLNASEELEAAYRWYLSRTPQNAFRFVDEVRIAVEQARRTPHTWPRYLHGTRRYRIKGFPYVLVYVEEEGKLFGIAVAHLNRQPGYWKNRLN